MAGTWENELIKTDLWLDTTNQDKPILKKNNPLTGEWRPVMSDPSGDTVQRPSTGLYVGYQYYDTTLGKPIWCFSTTGPVWKDAAGATV